jgi:hypothetical protein
LTQAGGLRPILSLILLRIRKIAWSVEGVYYYTLLMKDNKTVGSNYRGISLISTSYKTLSNILLSRLIPHIDELIG